MEIFRFIKWQWNRFSTDEKVLITLITIAVVTLGTTLYLGFTVGAALLSTGASLIVNGIGIGVYIALRNQWGKYKRYREHEAQMIVDKLRGR